MWHSHYIAICIYCNTSDCGIHTILTSVYTATLQNVAFTLYCHMYRLQHFRMWHPHYVDICIHCNTSECGIHTILTSVYTAPLQNVAFTLYCHLYTRIVRPQIFIVINKQTNTRDIASNVECFYSYPCIVN